MHKAIRPFSHLIVMARLRLILLVIAAALDLEICKIDIDSIFVYAPIKDDVCMTKFIGLSDGSVKIYHMKLCLYGIKEPPRV
jgi:hypothetical protein